MGSDDTSLRGGLGAAMQFMSNYEDEPRKHIALAQQATQLLLKAAEGGTRGGTAETPSRFAKAWDHWTSGYRTDIEALLKTFEDGAEGVDEMVVQVDIPFWSRCEHHLAPFWGVASVGYIPNGRVLGLSKMNRLVEAFALRLQVQERMTNQIADALCEHLQPLGCGVVIRARHSCVESRGIQHRGCSTTTSALRGAMKENADTRAEFMALARTNTPL